MIKINIRPLCAEDARISYQWRNDPYVFKYTGATYNHEITYEQELSWIRKVTVNSHEYRCAIIADDEYVGNIYLTDIHDGEAIYHIFIGRRDYWGKGIARRASELLIDYGFKKLQLKAIRLKVRVQNLRAVALYKTLGFIPTTTTSDNEWIEMILNKNIYMNNTTKMGGVNVEPIRSEALLLAA